MATKDICTVEQIDNSTDITNIIIDESGNLRKVNLKKAVNNFTPPQEKIEQIQQNTNDIAWIRGDISDLKTQVSSLSEENTELKGDLSVIADFTEESTNIFDKNAEGIETGGIYLSNGNWYANPSFAETDFMPCEGGGTTYYIYANTTLHCNWYNAEKTRLNGATTTLVSDTVQKITIASNNARFLRVGFDYSTIDNFYVSSTVEPTIIKKAILKDGQQWNGKKWIAFGTSITDTSYTNAETGEVTGKYVPYLAEISGLKVENKGIAGGLWATNILSAVCSANIGGADLITIEGCVNDFAVGTEIGNIGDTTNETLMGCMYLMAKYCMENSNAVVVFITETTGKQYTLKDGTQADYRMTYKKANGHYQVDYNNAIIECAKFLGCPCIDAGTKSQINYFNPQYIIDQIHHTELGGKQYAQTIWNELKNIQPLKVE